jgi:lipopolysaccharide biosynthesis glycosyltransferase
MNNNCVYYCIYGDDKEYQRILTLSLKSLNKFFDKENIIVFSENNIEEIQGYAKIIETDFPNGYAIPMAYRLILGKKLIEEYQYNNIIHLDVDTVVIDNIDDIFNKFQDNEISFATESLTNKDKITGGYWAGPLLNSDDLIKYQDILSICCGVFGFNKTISNQLENIYNNVVEKENKGFRGICKDQHAFTEYILKNNLYNYNLQDYVEHTAGRFRNQDFIDNDKLSKIYHFAGGVTSHNKYGVMQKFCSLARI